MKDNKTKNYNNLFTSYKYILGRAKETKIIKDNKEAPVEFSDTNHYIRILINDIWEVFNGWSKEEYYRVINVQGKSYKVEFYDSNGVLVSDVEEIMFDANDYETACEIAKIERELLEMKDYVYIVTEVI